MHFEKIREALNELIKPAVYVNVSLDQVRAECLERVQKIAEMMNLHAGLAGYYIRPTKPPVLVDSYTLMNNYSMPIADITFYISFEKRDDVVVAAVAGVDLLLMFRFAHDNRT